MLANETVRPEAARSVANKPLPPVPADATDKSSLVLFYQYVEPQWTPKEHKRMMKEFIALAEKWNVKGRGRCAAEGVNCTLTGPPDAIRSFCYGLRDWQPSLFAETDFKITDGLAHEHAFKALTIQKKDDLVAYGLPSEVAPTLKTSQARHVEADEYHKLMANPNSVIIDVRNAYESAIGHFQPPEGGAELIDPKLRNSIEFPKWLNAPETQAKLNGKQVLMYCTGGIRCERASALLDAMARTSGGSFAVKDTVMVRGGIERYMKTFPEGGHWKGKNYLFDRRQEQVPEAKTEEALEADVESYCCVCRAPYGYYRGQFTCAGWLSTTNAKCGVPVIVCSSCAQTAPEPSSLICPLCEEGYVAPAARPDLHALKHEFEEKALGEQASVVSHAAAAGAPTTASGKRARQEARAAASAPSTRLFVGNLPFVVSATSVRRALLAALRGEALGPEETGVRATKKQRRAAKLLERQQKATGAAPVAASEAPAAAHGGEWPDETVVAVQWLADHTTGLFYGSAFVEVRSVDAATALVRAAALVEIKSDGGTTAVEGGVRLKGRRLRIQYAPPKASDDWPPPAGEECEWPPVGHRLE